MKLAVQYAVGVIGIVSAIIGIIGAMPEYQNELFFVAGFSVCGLFIVNTKQNGNVQNENASMLLACAMFLCAPVGVGVMIWLVSKVVAVDKDMVTGMLFGGGTFVVISYLVAGCICETILQKQTAKETDLQPPE